ncbi:hypothetical protein H5203_18820 [Pseudoalteromonas sp. SG41-1]|uniref:hypothetical protein n=1 Tax=Pseudoalteromonas sp. SG41-1 TaxID=2760979 RepID=UPI0016044AB6|nr:hypothetical protein [Pseudoalteromonas sp. SG41-1]MBB1507522.1 hypothetical protein [Pseudoalteromonas sp. SG41-1]
MKNIFVFSFILLLTACGGGGDSSSNTPTTPTQPTNNAPTLTVNPNSLEMDENTSREVSLSYSDTDGDNVSITIEESFNYLSTNVSGNTLTITAGEVSANQQTSITVVASDGKTSTRRTVQVKVNDTVIVGDNSAPVITMDVNSFEVMVGQDLGFITYSIIDPDGDEVLFETLEYNNTAGIEVKPYNGYFDVKGLTEGENRVSFSMEDSFGNRSEDYVFTVNVITEDQEDENNHAPVLTFTGDTFADIYANEEVYRVFNITDEDGNEDFWCSLELDEATNLPENFQYEIDCANRWLKLKTGDINRDGFISFNIKVNDGKFDSNTAYVGGAFVEDNADRAEIIMDYEKPFFRISKNETKVLPYSIEDDKPEGVIFERIEYWYGDTNEVFVSHEDGQFVIETNDNASFGESYGYALLFLDGNQPITVNFEILIVSDPNTEANQAALKVKQKYENSLTQTREFNALGYFYTDYLFNVSKITATEKEAFDNKIYADNRSAYGLIETYLYTLQSDIDNNVFNENPEHLNAYIAIFNNQFMPEMSNSGRSITPLINELAALDENLFEVQFTSDFVWLDEYEIHSSKFIGNTTYGEFNSDKWQYSEEYRLLRAITTKTNHTHIVE